MGMKLILTGFKKLASILDPAKTNARMRKHVQVATNRNALLGASEVVRAIYSGRFQANSPLTVALKGSSRPLVDTGALASSVSGKATSWNEAVISANRNRQRTGREKGRKRQPATNIALLLYRGATIKVTKPMRRLFYAMSRENPQVRPLKKGTTVIVVPPRRYMDAALTPPLLAKYKENWEGAIRLVMLGVA